MRDKSKFPLLLENIPIASGPAAASGQPGCKASGESQGIIPRKKRAFSLGFSRLSWARSFKLS
jgi:hypothetical protein